MCHGDKSQGNRRRALREFKEGKVRVLVATEVAARGIDIDGLPRVINIDLPWLDLDKAKMLGIFNSIPERDQMNLTINEQLVVELYSK